MLSTASFLAMVPEAVAEPLRLPAHRSPYGLDSPISGEENSLVRPYLAALEGRCRQETQAYRRLVLVLAADFGVDLDECVVGTAA
ncbi:hypothetical protein [Streptomyces sp. NBC_00356]|uniref:hypothetical protein n=1 Tax=Streptomyces sp. NBC_00356 TaxID=2975724 RepID=UPI002E2683B3